jgi:hypothetical protein
LPKFLRNAYRGRNEKFLVRSSQLFTTSEVLKFENYFFREADFKEEGSRGLDVARPKIKYFEILNDLAKIILAYLLTR